MKWRLLIPDFRRGRLRVIAHLAISLILCLEFDFYKLLVSRFSFVL